MKPLFQKLPITLLGTFAAIAITGAPIGGNAEDKVKIKDDTVIVKTPGGKAKIDEEGNVISVTGPNGDAAVSKARAVLSQQEAAEFKQRLVTGYAIPKDRYVYLDPLPSTYLDRIPTRRTDVEYRVYDGVVYAVNPQTYTVVEVIGTDIAGSPVTVTTEVAPTFDPVAFKSSLVKGYVVPGSYYTHLQPVPETVVTKIPAAPAGTVYRYYDGNVYAINPETYAVIDVIAY